MIVRYAWLVWRSLRRRDAGHLVRSRPMNFASPFSLSLCGDHRPVDPRPADRPFDDRRLDPLPVLTGPGLGTAAEQLMNGLYNSFVLLAVPLFMLAADLMNVGSMSERLLRFCDALVGRFRGGLGHVNIVQSMIFAGMSGSAIADAAGPGTRHDRHDDARRPVPARASPRRSLRPRPRSGRSSRPRSRWCCTPSSPTPRSATCSWAA